MSVTDIDTTTRRALCFTPMETDRALIVEAAVRAEQLGYEAVIVPEGWGFDSGVVLTEIALRTDRIRLVAGVQSVWGRTPAQLAMEATTLADVSDGRFVLGIGASTPQLASGLHGIPYERPAGRVADALDTVRALLTGERATAADGSSGLRLALRTHHEVPIWIAGLGPRTTQLAIDRADGWFPAFIPADQLGEAHAALHLATGCELIVSPAAAVADDPAFAKEIARQLVGWYLVGMGRLYGDRLAESGFAREVATLRLANPKPKPAGVVWPDEVDHLLDELAVHGDTGTVADGLTRWDPLADVVAVTPAPGIGEGVLDVVEAASPSAARHAPAPAIAQPAASGR